jgi:protease-4
MRKYLVIIIIVFVIFAGISVLGAYVLTRHDHLAFGDKVAVIKIYGTISMSSSSGFLEETRATPDKFREALTQAEEDGSVKAILLEINSPGGSVVASDEMALAIKEARNKKPVVAWMGEIATSGAYYIASAADYIVADRGTITGSIGVISVFPEYSKLLQKLGINVTVVKGGMYKDFSMGYRPMTEEERGMLEDLVQEIYDQFLKEVAANRNLSETYVKSVAEGRIYSGTTARELRLVDDIGGEKYAIRKAAELGGIKGEPVVVTYGKKGIFEEFLGKASAGFGYGFAKGLLQGKESLKVG